MRTAPPDASPRNQLIEVAALFLRLGVTSFGGPAAYIAIMHDEVVKHHRWVTDQEFLDLLGGANLIPGPTSTEMAIYLGYRRVGWLGLVLGGVCFILPAMLIVMALSWAYLRYGTTPLATGILYGIMPVVMAIIAQALWGLGRKAVKNWLTGVIGLATVISYMLGVNILLILLIAGLAAMIGGNLSRIKRVPVLGILLPLAGFNLLAAPAPFSLTLLFLNFLKIGATLYGSGYVLLAFLRADFVLHLGWLTDKQLIDAIAVGQVTPGPVFTTATFIGFLLGGLPGSILATLGIFLPSFIYVAISSLVIKQIRNSPWASRFLDGVNAASLGLMLAVSLQLASTALIDPITIGMAVICLIILIRFQTNSTWLIASGAVVGLLHTVL
ncbi:MAG TPA: chromate efflux transporter [Anaerolineales bacterium]|nr:chromate efflux transporter [Anaerolineales bacterium]